MVLCIREVRKWFVRVYLFATYTKITNRHVICNLSSTRLEKRLGCDVSWTTVFVVIVWNDPIRLHLRGSQSVEYCVLFIAECTCMTIWGNGFQNHTDKSVMRFSRMSSRENNRSRPTNRLGYLHLSHYLNILFSSLVFFNYRFTFSFRLLLHQDTHFSLYQTHNRSPTINQNIF